MLVLMLPRVSSRVSGFPLASPCLWGKLQDCSFSKVSKQVVMSFCVAGAALCDIPTCLITCRKSFCVASAILLRPLEIFIVILRGTPTSSHVSCCMLYTPCSTLHPLHFTLHTLHSTLYTLHFTLYTSHSTLYSPHLTLHTLHCTLSTPHSTLYT